MPTTDTAFPNKSQSTVGWIGGEPVFDLVLNDCPRDFQEAKEAFEREFISAALRLHGGNITNTALMIGISRRHLRSRIVVLHINPKAGQSALPLSTKMPHKESLTAPAERPLSSDDPI